MAVAAVRSHSPRTADGFVGCEDRIRNSSRIGEAEAADMETTAQPVAAVSARDSAKTLCAARASPCHIVEDETVGERHRTESRADRAADA